MGIHGIYKEIGPGERIALSKLAVETYEKTGRPLRLAIDISIWLFQIQSSKGGTNPALRTFYYRLLRLISLSIHPLFVFDGPHKPPFKRNKKTGPTVASIPEFLAKQLLKQFGLPFHAAPGEAEAECALLQREGIVDAVLSEDVDTLMFGSGLTLCKWSSEGTLKSKVATHVNVYDAEKTKSGKSGLDREGMVLVALMSGGDYIPKGIPGCGPKLACEAARAGFGRDLCKIPTKDKDKIAIGQWRERLAYELRTNESKFFKQKHKALVIPEDFPNIEVLGYYTHPVVSDKEKLDRLKQTLKWDQDIDFVALRTFTAEAFDWRCLGGARKFVRNLAPALLIRELRMRGDPSRQESGSIETIQERESKLVKALHGKRNHVTTDNMTELRLTLCPVDLVNIDLDSEEADDMHNEPGSDSEEDVLPVLDEEAPDPAAPSKKRAPSTYDPTQLDKIWVLETWVKVGVPLKLEDWEESFRNHKKYLAAKTAAKDISKASKARRAATTGGMPRSALDAYTKVIKPGISLADKPTAKIPAVASQTLEHLQSQNPETQRRTPPITCVGRALPSIQSPHRSQHVLTIDLLSSPEARPQAKALTLQCLPPILDPADGLPDSVTKRKRRTPIRRWHTMPVSSTPHSPELRPTTPPPTQLGKTDVPALSSPELPSPSVLLHTPAKDRAGLATQAQSQAIDILLSSPPRTIPEWIRRSQSATPSKTLTAPLLPPSRLKAAPLLPSPIKELDMTSSPHQRKKQKPTRPLTDTTSNLAPSSTQTQKKLPKLSEHQRTAGNHRRSPRQHPTSSTQPVAPWKQHPIKKRNITLRESLEGAWKFADRMDLTVSPERPELLKAQRHKRRPGEAATAGDVAFLGGDVSVVDLTASPG